MEDRNVKKLVLDAYIAMSAYFGAVVAEKYEARPHRTISAISSADDGFGNFVFKGKDAINSSFAFIDS